MKNVIKQFTLRLPKKMVEKIDEKRSAHFGYISRNYFILQVLESSFLVSKEDLMELIYWARRYCDGRSTYAPTRFNWIYQRIRSSNPDLMRCEDQFDETLTNKGTYWPYAQDGQYNPKDGNFEARPKDMM